MRLVLTRKLVLRHYAPSLVRFSHKQFNDDYTAKDFLPRDYKGFVEDKWSSVVLESSKAGEETSKSEPHKYIMSMFPYPSGKLHMGHVRVYTLTDVLARFFRLRKFRVIHPMGWDAFGLPAENAARERNLTPDKWTYANIAYMREQLDQIGLDFDWNRSFATCDPTYYKWTQSIFLDLLEAGLVYRSNAWVNWDPVDETVLAEEQVDAEGRSWRSGALVERKLLKQWFIRTTRFAEALYETLTEGQMESGWREVVLMQKHWIGVPDGIRVEFEVCESYLEANPDMDPTISSWTPAPHLLFRAGFLLLQPNHPAVHDLVLLDQGPALHVKNPLTGIEIPVFVVPGYKMKEMFDLEYPKQHDTYVGFPGENRKHDEVLRKLGGEPAPWNAIIESDAWKLLFKGSNSPTTAEATKEICQYLLKQRLGGYKTSSRLKDWLISRQRFWGTPIPIIHCRKCGAVPAPELPVKLPVCLAMPKGSSPLKQFADWSLQPCPKCGGSAERESDTMDTFMDSSWYYLRYLDPQNLSEPFSKEAVKDLPVNIYVGGKDHAVLHLFYARFLHKFFFSEGRVFCPEPFHALCPVGQVMALTYKEKASGRYLPPDMIQTATENSDALLVDKVSGEPVEVVWEKMSKSRHNGVDPKDTTERIGIDTLRLLILDDAVPRSERRFSLHTLPGIERWQKRIVEIVEEFCGARRDAVRVGQEKKAPWLQSRADQSVAANDMLTHDHELIQIRNKMVSIVTHEIGTLNRISVAIRRMMNITKELRIRPRSVVEKSKEYEKLLAAHIIMLAPLAPHLACELWDGIAAVQNHAVEDFDWGTNVLLQKWPQVDDNFPLNFYVLVNGREKVQERFPKSELFSWSDSEAIEKALVLPQMEILRTKASEAHVDLSHGAWVSRSDEHNVTVHLRAANHLTSGKWAT
ncbi:unnamed protein product [Notodromas monacha]|uniref:leucine--tRNA ligase n=1 Tax=Notodromas monacha TaxID=399045 RepID=A0A7R9BEH2_9CRUS|nr:unnamed protein product [Notodromas monacha]CAG0913886.1 unnamed protein product [Notodromas monacha]